jgi:PST family polysaccharide transporter
MNYASPKLPALIRILPGFVQRRIAGRPNLIKVLDNIGWLFFDKILRMGVGLIVGVWVARYLGPEQFGLFNYSVAFVGLFGVVAGLGLQSIVVRDIVRNPLGKAETIGSAAALQFVSGLIAYGLTLITIFWLRPDDAIAKAIVAILGSVMMVKVSDVAVYWFEAQVQSKFIVWVQNSVFLIFASLKVFFILQNASIFSFVWVAMAEAVIVAVLMLVMLGLHGPHFRELRVSISRVKILLIDSWPLFLSGIAVTVYMKIDQIMIGQILNDQAVGIYSAAVRISELWYFIPMAIVTSVFPSILEAKKLSEDIYYKRLQRLYDLMVWLSLCVAVPMTFLSSWLVTSFFGEAYEAAGAVLAVHIWSAVFVFLGVASEKWFLAENRQALSLQRAVLGALVNVVLNVVLIPRYEILGAAYATVIAQLFTALLFDLAQQETRQMFVMKMSSLNVYFMVRRIIFICKDSK